MTELESENDALAKRIAQLETDLAISRRQTAEAEAALHNRDFDADLSALREHVAAIESDLTRQSARNAELELEIARIEAAASDVGALREENRRLEAALAAEKERSRRIERDLQTLRDGWLNDVRRAR